MMNERLEFLKYLALESGNILNYYWNLGVKASLKQDGSIVTVADFEVSRFIQNEISKKFPFDVICDEEVVDSKIRLNNKGVWIIDPLDGSSDFHNKQEDFCFIGAYIMDGKPSIGVIYEPRKERLFFAQNGEGAYLSRGNDIRKLNLTNRIDWCDSIVGHPKNYSGDKYTKLYALMGISENRIRYSGSMGTRMIQVALQETHMILGYTRNLKEWDIAAGDLILSEMGLSVTDITGNHLRYNKENQNTTNGFIVAHPDIKEQVLMKLQICSQQLNL